MAEITPRVCVDCKADVLRRTAMALCPGCALTRKRASAREQYYKAQAKKGLPRRGDLIDCVCSYCEAEFRCVLAGNPRRVCDGCVKRRSGQARQRWGQLNPDKIAEIKSRYRRNNPDKVLTERQFARYRRYGVTAEWERLTLDAQGHKCGNPSCGATSPGGRWDTWHIDHCHRTGVVRGLLCDRCNKGVGLFDDDVDKLAGMIEYLTRERSSD